jgi:hypothetical protein
MPLAERMRMLLLGNKHLLVYMAHVKFMFVNVSSVRTCLIGHHAFHHQYVRDVLVLAILP